MKKLLCALVALALAACLTGCGSDSRDVYPLSFKGATELSKIQSLDGKDVTIVGYMATLSPISGEYMYLMNLPYQSCPFCVPNTTQLSNTMAVYAKNGETFSFTDQAVRVTGKMEIGTFSDDFGYEYTFRIVDANIETVDLSTISSEYSLWMSLAGDGVVGEISSMFDYLYFLCQWANFQYYGYNDDGSRYTFYPYPGDVSQLLASGESYGYARYAAEDYFPSLETRVKAISDTGLSDLLAILADAKTLEQYALSEFNNGNYIYDEVSDRYILNNNQELYDRFYELFGRFGDWLTKWEL